MKKLLMSIALLSLVFSSCRSELEESFGRAVENGFRLYYNIERSSFPVTRSAIAPEEGEELREHTVRR